MKSKQVVVKSGDMSPIKELKDSDLSFVFGSLESLRNNDFQEAIKDNGMGKVVIGCSTAGEIADEGVLDDTMVVTSIQFDNPFNTKVAHAPVGDGVSSKQCGLNIGEQLKGDDLQFVFVLGPGIDVNGSEIIAGIEEVIGTDVPISGGLAGDNAKFENTSTLLNGKVFDRETVAFGVYGAKGIYIGYGSHGGWEPFGPTRKVTKAEGNVLYELDGEPALAVYEKYLGDKAQELPASGLLYPFAIVDSTNEGTGLIRTILGIDKDQGSLTLAGDVQVNGLLRLMHSGLDGLVDGARKAAEFTKDTLAQPGKDGVGILVSCVGRKIVMGSDIEDELDAVKEELPEGALFTGFYSYGEICPFQRTQHNKLHNQTMTITYFSED